MPSSPPPTEVLQTWTVLQDGPISRVIVFSLSGPKGEPWTKGDNSAGSATPHAFVCPHSLPPRPQVSLLAPAPRGSSETLRGPLP